ncbi:conserved membrane hypothetical protein [Candidatus Desulfarcum epimagneticum]|uniref:Rod shape-determining protein MreD n=1 Tax=uncultured Desulfobacteraceae bacterium TaxID=218296 RepID=A0A484HFX1_9BACT|nr:conserved membrane hypothetical protein [uncultured Desulfobacteraceae bacterium]
MIYLFHTGAALFLIIIRSSFMPYFRILDGFFDPLAAWVIYLGIFRPFGESLFGVLFAGFMMDALTGGPFGLYMTAYFWIFLGIRRLMAFVDIKDFFLKPVVISAGVFAQNVIFFFPVAMASPGSGFLSRAAGSAAEQIFWAVCAGPFLMVLIENAYRRVEGWQTEFLAKRRGRV